jgi:hypothetical protein
MRKPNKLVLVLTPVQACAVYEILSGGKRHVGATAAKWHLLTAMYEVWGTKKTDKLLKPARERIVDAMYPSTKNSLDKGGRQT